ncbi:MAG: VCBS repeat-containing protein [Planctomycetota bacterium]
MKLRGLMPSWRHCATVLLTAALTGVPAFANDLEPIEQVIVPNGRTYRYPARQLDALQSERFIRAWVGNFTSDSVPDLLVQRGTEGQCFVAPTLFDAALTLPRSVAGATRLTATRPDGRDEMLIATASGLRALWLDSTTGIWNERVVGTDAVWADVQRPYAADLDEVNGPDVIGLSNDGMTGWIVMATPSGFAEEVAIPLPVPAQAVLACDFDGAGDRQVVFLDDAMLRVFDANGQPRFNIPAPGTDIATVVKIRGNAQESIAWIRQDPSGDQLYTFDVQFLRGPWPLGDLSAVGVASGDLDGDGYDELVVSHKSDWSLKVFTGFQGGNGPTHVQTLFTGTAQAAGDNEAWPCVVNLDGDGDEDLIIPVQEDESIWVHLNGEDAELEQVPQFDGPVHFNHGSFTQGGPLVGLLQIHASPAAEPPPGATHLEILVWRKPDLVMPTGSDYEYRVLFPIGGEYDTDVIEFEEPDGGILFWLQRYLTIDGTEVTAHPARLFAHSTELYSETEPLEPVLDYLINNLGGEFFAIAEPDPMMTTGGFYFSRSTTTIIELIPLPDFEDEEEPGTGEGN